jgi:hypothetical protein
MRKNLHHQEPHFKCCAPNVKLHRTRGLKSYKLFTCFKWCLLFPLKTQVHSSYVLNATLDQEHGALGAGISAKFQMQNAKADIEYNNPHRDRRAGMEKSSARFRLQQRASQSGETKASNHFRKLMTKFKTKDPAAPKGP